MNENSVKIKRTRVSKKVNKGYVKISDLSDEEASKRRAKQKAKYIPKDQLSDEDYKIRYEREKEYQKKYSEANKEKKNEKAREKYHNNKEDREKKKQNTEEDIKKVSDIVIQSLYEKIVQSGLVLPIFRGNESAIQAGALRLRSNPTDIEKDWIILYNKSKTDYYKDILQKIPPVFPDASHKAGTISRKQDKSDYEIEWLNLYNQHRDQNGFKLGKKWIAKPKNVNNKPNNTQQNKLSLYEKGLRYKNDKLYYNI